MKKIIRSAARIVTGLALVIGISMALAPAPAAARELASDVPLYTPGTIASLSTNSHDAYTNKVAIEPGTIVVAQITAYAANAGNSNIVLRFKNSLNGTSSSVFSTAVPYSLTVGMNGTNVITTNIVIGTNLLTKFIGCSASESAQTNLVTVAVRLLQIPFF